MVRRLVRMLITLAVLGVVPGVASAQTWTVQSVPAPAGASGSLLDGVSCVSASACMAVGWYALGSTGNHLPFAEQWDGTSWTLETVPDPAGSNLTSLYAVSCTAAGACTAVGSYESSNGLTGLVERWDGSSWAIQAMPNLPGSSPVEFYGVSCAASTACTAVGGSDLGPVAEGWNGQTWTIQTAAPGGELRAVACTSPTACTAVGNVEASTLAERWSGTAWAPQVTPNPPGNNQLPGVNCATRTACTAVGWYQPNMSSSPSPTGSAFAEGWNGSSWTLQNIANPAGASASALYGVSCHAAGACTAVGDSYYPANSTFLTLAERWTGSSWTTESPPNPGSFEDALSAVSCTSSTTCTAVGSAARQPLAEQSS